MGAHTIGQRSTKSLSCGRKANTWRTCVGFPAEVGFVSWEKMKHLTSHLTTKTAPRGLSASFSCGNGQVAQQANDSGNQLEVKINWLVGKRWSGILCNWSPPRSRIYPSCEGTSPEPGIQPQKKVIPRVAGCFVSAAFELPWLPPPERLA